MLGTAGAGSRYCGGKAIVACVFVVWLKVDRLELKGGAMTKAADVEAKLPDLLRQQRHRTRTEGISSRAECGVSQCQLVPTSWTRVVARVSRVPVGELGDAVQSRPRANEGAGEADAQPTRWYREEAS